MWCPRELPFTAPTLGDFFFYFFGAHIWPGYALIGLG